MSAPTTVLLVRFRTALSLDEASVVMKERAPEFRALEGLHQKYYLHDPATGEVAGLYLWTSKRDLDEYAQSELRASIGAAYQAVGEPRVEVYDVLMPLRTQRT